MLRIYTKFCLLSKNKRDTRNVKGIQIWVQKKCTTSQELETELARWYYGSKERTDFSFLFFFIHKRKTDTEYEAFHCILLTKNAKTTEGNLGRELVHTTK